MSDPVKCKECGSDALFWFEQNINKSGIAEGRLRTNEVTCQFVLGCADCSATLKTVYADRIAERMNDEKSQLAALREELANRTDRVAELAQKRNDLQQRLADAERRNAELVDLLQSMSPWLEQVMARSQYDLEFMAAFRAALNKPEEAKL